jgi:hypothetical protein
MQEARDTFLPLASLCSFGAAGNPRVLYHTTISSSSGRQPHNAPNTSLFCLFLFPTLPASCPTAPPSSRTFGTLVKSNATASALGFAVDSSPRRLPSLLQQASRTLALLFALADDDDRVVDDFGLGCLSLRCWNEGNLGGCSVDEDVGRRHWYDVRHRHFSHL